MAADNEESTVGANASQALGTLLQDPDSMSKIGSILSKYIGEENESNSPPSAENESKESAPPPVSASESENSGNITPTLQSSAPPDILAELPRLMSLFSPSKSEVSAAEKQQINLLLAIKPYLSEHRRELIDGYIKMSQFGEIFKKLIQGDKNVL